VDRSEVFNPGGQLHGVVQLVEQPEGWDPSLAQTLMGTYGGTSMLPRDTSFRARNFKMQKLSPPPAASTTDFAPLELAEALEEPVEASYRCEDLDLRRASGPGWIQRTLSLIFGRKERKRARSAAIDRAQYRQQALDLLQALQASQAADGSAKFAALRSLSAKLEELFQKIIAAGDRDPSVKSMGESLLSLHTLLAAVQLAETEILVVWRQIENCLQRWLALSDTPNAPRREGFWK
jgi:hypothetical protein